MECKTKRILDVSDLIKKKSIFLFGPRQTGKSTLVDQLPAETFALKWNLLKGKLRLQVQTNPSYSPLDIICFTQNQDNRLNAQIKDMPLFPFSGSVQKIDDKIYVKFSELAE